ncbi:MAG TPA: glycosyltransferase [Parafilimonas sp.]|nr:glycosyltransferase [Parafilimonas sp.]
MPLISICIPAYKNTHYLSRLLDSISIQTFKDFEVIISDDSPDFSVKEILAGYETKFPTRYYRNEPSLGTPANWNFAISKAVGEWIKLMHDDDWFTGSESLQIFADHTKQNKKFVFSAYTNYFEDDYPDKQEVFMPFLWKRKILRMPDVLFAKNVIGPPSVTMLHKTIGLLYDERLKWRVDQEFYIRVLRKDRSFLYINKPLINVGISALQVTQSCKNIPSVELPEGFIMLEKYGTLPMKNLLIYDAWWRLFRNMDIKNEKRLKQYANEKWPTVILHMIHDLSKINKALLRNGVISKSYMFISYLKNQSSIV